MRLLLVILSLLLLMHSALPWSVKERVMNRMQEIPPRTLLACVADNAGVCLLYWAMSELNYLVFREMGIQPMPLWPAAALAFVACFYHGWRITPGVAAGAVCANWLALGGSLGYSCLIAIMNTLAPLLCAWLMRRRVGRNLQLRGVRDLLVCFFLLVVLTPALTALGGVGFKWLLGGVPAAGVFGAWMKWTFAHAVANMLLGVPFFVLMKARETTVVREA